MTKKKDENIYSTKRFQTTHILKFLIPSLIGIILFIFPIQSEGNLTIPIAVLSNWCGKILEGVIAEILLAFITISFVGSFLIWILKTWKKEIKLPNYIVSLFEVTPLWLIIRFIAVVLSWITYLKFPMEEIYSSNTGGLVFYELLPVLFTIFLLAGLCLPLLLDFGLLEFSGALLIKVMKPIFQLPGRAAIDSIASWLGDGTIGVLLTSKQYEEGFYTEREACVIGTNFSLVSITFSLVVINTVGLSHMFIPFYITITIAGILAAILTPKIPPLSRKKNRLYDGTMPNELEEILDGRSSFSYGLEMAVQKAEKENVVKRIFLGGIHNVLSMWLGVIPIVMVIGTVALIIAEYTPVFKILGLPFLPILQLLQIPEATAASQTLIAGFADMLLPSVLISNVGSEITKFTVAAVSVTQLIYLSEVGAMLLASKIPLNLKELFIIFIERTLITLPIVALIAHLLF